MFQLKCNTQRRKEEEYMGSIILERYLGKNVTVTTTRGNFSGVLTQSGEQYVIEGETFAPNEIKNIIWT